MITSSAASSGDDAGNQENVTKQSGTDVALSSVSYSDHTLEGTDPSIASGAERQASSTKGKGLRYQPSLFGLDGDQVDQQVSWLLALWDAIGAPPFTMLSNAHELARGAVTTYQGVDLEYHSKRMANWWRSNPSKTINPKTKKPKDAVKFIDGWFARQYEKEHQQNGSASADANGISAPGSSDGGRAGVIWGD
jgi:hypothetical protein